MSIEKIDLHYHQQLSALVDGELPPDQARFLLRRLGHDSELAGCIDRWQLLGDVLRGQAHAPAPEGFGARVAAAVALEQAEASARPGVSRKRVAAWGGGALAASVAAVAFFLAGEQISGQAPAAEPAALQAAVEPATPSTSTAPAVADPAPAVGLAAAAGAAAASRAPAEAAARRSATRTRQAARAATLAAREPERAAVNAPLPVIHSIAVAPQPLDSRNPFADVRMDSPVARPWPRAVLPQYSQGSFNADYGGERSSRTFYPFEPQMSAPPPLAVPDPAAGEDR